MNSLIPLAVSALIAAILVVGYAPLPSVDAKCCLGHRINRTALVCDDCTVPTPFCGYKPCNIFGCMCGGGCRTPAPGGKSCMPKTLEPNSWQTNEPLTVANFDQHSVETKFATIDRDGDGRLSLGEFDDWVKATRTDKDSDKRIAELYEGFKKMDQNSNGYVSKHEVDDSYPE